MIAVIEAIVRSPLGVVIFVGGFILLLLGALPARFLFALLRQTRKNPELSKRLRVFLVSVGLVLMIVPPVAQIVAASSNCGECAPTVTPTPSPTSTPTLTPTLTPTYTPTPTPTNTSTPAPTSTPTPVPQARISEPVDNQHIPPKVNVIVQYKNIPHDRYFWVAVRIPNVQAPASEPPLTRWIYPQLQRGQEPSQPEGTGTFVVNAAFGGGSEDSGAPFNILVLLVDANAQGSFTAYAERCGTDPQTCRGMKLPDTGVEILDFNTVIRQ